MYERQSKSDHSQTPEGDIRLSALLHEWKAVEPQADFEAAVWRRIRTASAAEHRRLTLVTTLREWFVLRPAWANAMATAAGIAVGVGLAFSSPEAHTGRHAHEPLLNAQTLTGSYLALVTGESR